MNYVLIIIMWSVYGLFVYSRYKRAKRKYHNPAIYFEQKVEVMNRVLDAEFDRQVTAMRERAAAIRTDDIKYLNADELKIECGTLVYVTQDDGTQVMRSVAEASDLEEVPYGFVIVVNRSAAFPFSEIVSVDRVRRVHSKGASEVDHD